MEKKWVFNREKNTPDIVCSYFFFPFSSNNSYNKTRGLTSILRASGSCAVPLKSMRGLWAGAFGCFTHTEIQKKALPAACKTHEHPLLPHKLLHNLCSRRSALAWAGAGGSRWVRCDLLCPKQPPEGQIRSMASCVEGFCSHPGSPQAPGQFFALSECLRQVPRIDSLNMAIEINLIFITSS